MHDPRTTPLGHEEDLEEIRMKIKNIKASLASFNPQICLFLEN